jgi:hypothetical protein
MANKTFLSLLALILVLTGAPVSLAQMRTAQQTEQEADRAWLRLQSIAPGAELILEPRNGDSFRGRFVSATQDHISLSIKSKNFDVARSLVRRLYSVKERSRSKSTLAGAGIGLAVGIGGGILVVAASDKTMGVNFAPVSLGFVGMLAGAAIGALKGGKHKGQLLYESK